MERLNARNSKHLPLAWCQRGSWAGTLLVVWSYDPIWLLPGTDPSHIHLEKNRYKGKVEWTDIKLLSALKQMK